MSINVISKRDGIDNVTINRRQSELLAFRSNVRLLSGASDMDIEERRVFSLSNVVYHEIFRNI